MNVLWSFFWHKSKFKNTIEFLVIVVSFIYFLDLWFKVVLCYTSLIIAETAIRYYLYNEINKKQLIFFFSFSLADFKWNAIMNSSTTNNTRIMDNLINISIKTSHSKIMVMVYLFIYNQKKKNSTPCSIPLLRVGERVRFPSMPWVLNVTFFCSEKFLVSILYGVVFFISTRIYKRTIISSTQILLYVQQIPNTKYQ